MNNAIENESFNFSRLGLQWLQLASEVRKSIRCDVKFFQDVPKIIKIG